ncbi:MAG: hypothetical protein ACHQ2Y_01510 [Candidatus Lutacidiplasmatales archaeon]
MTRTTSGDHFVEVNRTMDFTVHVNLSSNGSCSGSVAEVWIEIGIWGNDTTSSYGGVWRSSVIYDLVVSGSPGSNSLTERGKSVSLRTWGPFNGSHTYELGGMLAFGVTAKAFNHLTNACYASATFEPAGRGYLFQLDSVTIL